MLNSDPNHLLWVAGRYWLVTGSISPVDSKEALLAEYPGYNEGDVSVYEIHGIVSKPERPAIEVKELR